MRTISVLLLALSWILVTPSISRAQTSRFAGTWLKVDKGDGGIIRIEVTVHGAKVQVRAFGACVPTPCDWGTINARVYGPSVDANIEREATALTAIDTTEFGVTLLVIKREGAELVVTTYAHFTDDSRRADFTDFGRFKRRRVRRAHRK